MSGIFDIVVRFNRVFSCNFRLEIKSSRHYEVDSSILKGTEIIALHFRVCSRLEFDERNIVPGTTQKKFRISCAYFFVLSKCLKHLLSQKQNQYNTCFKPHLFSNIY